MLIGFILLAAIVVSILVVAKPPLLFGDNKDMASQPPLYATKEEALQGFLLTLPEATRQQLEQPSSPQQAAWTWLTQDPYFLERTFPQHTQRFALATIYYSFNGTAWQLEQQEDWLSHELSECDWTEVALCSEEQYRTLVLKGLPTKGSLPLEVGLLTGLREIDITDMAQPMDLLDFLPRTLAALPKLECLDLSNNNFEGSSIPPDVGRLTQLEQLKIHDSKLEGMIPTEMNQLTALDTLSLYANKLTGTLPAVWGQTLTNLETIWLQQNELTGTLPTEWNTLPMQFLSLHYNQLNGTLPSEWSAVSSMMDLRLGFNDFSGTIPHEWSEMSNIDNIGLEGNPQLGGSIPPTWCSRV